MVCYFSNDKLPERKEPAFFVRNYFVAKRKWNIWGLVLRKTCSPIATYFHEFLMPGAINLNRPVKQLRWRFFAKKLTAKNLKTFSQKSFIIIVGQCPKYISVEGPRNATVTAQKWSCPLRIPSVNAWRMVNVNGKCNQIRSLLYRNLYYLCSDLDIFSIFVFTIFLWQSSAKRAIL